jgi:hypothetical protein
MNDENPRPEPPKNRCPMCGKKDVAESARDARDADALCWCDPDEKTGYVRGWNAAITAAIALLHEDQQERFMKLATRMATLSEGETK